MRSLQVREKMNREKVVSMSKHSLQSSEYYPKNKENANDLLSTIQHVSCIGYSFDRVFGCFGHRKTSLWLQTLSNHKMAAWNLDLYCCTFLWSVNHRIRIDAQFGPILEYLHPFCLQYICGAPNDP